MKYYVQLFIDGIVNFPHIWTWVTFRSKNLRGRLGTRESCQLQESKWVSESWSLLGTSLSLNPGDSSVQWSSEPKWRRGEELLSAHLMTLTAATLSCLREPSSQVHTFCNDKTEPQVRRKARVLRASVIVKCVSKWDVFENMMLPSYWRKSYIISERTASIYLPFRDILFSLQQLMCTIHTSWWRTGRWVSVTCFVESWEGSHMQSSICCRLQLPRSHQQCQLCLVYRAVLWLVLFHSRSHHLSHKCKALIHCEYSRNHNRLFSRSIHSRAK